MTNKLEVLRRQADGAQAELVAARADRAKMFTELAGMARPSEAAAARVAALDVRISAMQVRHEDAAEQVKAEQARLESPEIRAAMKEIKAIRTELIAARPEVTHALAAVAPIVERMTTRWSELNRLSDLVGDGSGLAGMEEFYRWLCNVLYDMKAMHERGSLFEPPVGNGHK